MDTEKLLRSIESASTVSEALRLVERENGFTPLSVILSGGMRELELSPQQLSKKIDVERSTLYRLLSGERLTTRNVLLRIAIVMRLSLEDTQNLLRSGQRAELCALVRRDALILYAIMHEFSLEETEAALLRKGEASLYERV